MTPPDSGGFCVICSLPATRGLRESDTKYWCDRHGPFDSKPDSGEREVTCTCGSMNDVHRIECATLAYLREPAAPFTGPPPMPDGWIAVRAPLAQRILAALEDRVTLTCEVGYVRSLADELRKVMGNG